MSFLKEYGFDESEINEFENNTPAKIKEVLNKNSLLVEENMKYIKNLGINTYKEIFINYPDMFLMDNSNFEEMFSKYETNELITKLNANFKMVEYL